MMSSTNIVQKALNSYFCFTILVGQHFSFQFIEVSCQSERQYLTINNCCLYIENPPYLLVFKSIDFIRDILYRYSFQISI
jgi:hypothetical protein